MTNRKSCTEYFIMIYVIVFEKKLNLLTYVGTLSERVEDLHCKRVLFSVL